MDLVVLRHTKASMSFLGELLLNGKHFCYTLEPAHDVPAGKYTVLVTFSPKFDQPMPLISGIPGFSGVRIHCGNTSQDTEGCLLVGDVQDCEHEYIAQSRIAFNRLYPLICAAEDSGETVTIEYQNLYPGA